MTTLAFPQDAEDWAQPFNNALATNTKGRETKGLRGLWEGIAECFLGHEIGW